MLEQFQALLTGSSKPYTLEKPVIKECYIAYLDMLGYRAFFEENPDKIEDMLSVFTRTIEQMIGYLQTFNSAFQIGTNIKEAFKIKVFSDNVLMWLEAKTSFESKFLLLAFLEVVKEFQTSLICSYSIFLRGGIIKGTLAVAENDTFVFGQGLIDVVDLEAKKAIFPRIIVHESIVNDLSNKTPCKGSGACNACNGLRNINKLFITGSTEELSERLTNAYKTFDEIIMAIPKKYNNITDEQIFSIRQNFYSQINIIKMAAVNNPKYLENELVNVKTLTPQMLDIFNGVLDYQINEHDKTCKIMMEGCFYHDDDNYVVINYLTPPSFIKLLTTELIEQTIKNISKAFPEFLTVEEEITTFAHHMMSYDRTTEVLTAHKYRVEAEVREKMSFYEKWNGNKEKRRSNERVLKKYLWSIKYHNKACDIAEKTNLKILFDVSFEPIEDLLFVHILPPQENVENEGGVHNG